MLERIIANKVWNLVDLFGGIIGDVFHRLSDLVDGHFNFWHIWFDNILDFTANLLHLPITLLNCFHQLAVQEWLNVSNDGGLIGKLW